MTKILFLNKEKTSLIYEGYRYSKSEKNKNQNIRWRCSTCQMVSITTDQDVVVRDNDKPHGPKCHKLSSMHIECFIKYSELKSLSKSKFFII